MHFGPLVVHRREVPGINQVRAEVVVRRTTCALILGEVTSRVPEHRHRDWELFWFLKPSQVTLTGDHHCLQWMVAMPGQAHSIEEPGRVVALKVGPRS